MAKLVRHLTSNEEIVSSNLAEGIFFFRIVFFIAMKEEDELKEMWALLDEPASPAGAAGAADASDAADAAFPSHMSITTAFDELLLCFLLGGQLKHYYRYGTYSLCQPQREKFWFALANGSFTEAPADAPPGGGAAATARDRTRQHNVQQFYKRRLHEHTRDGSSEDVWDARTEPLERPFNE